MRIVNPPARDMGVRGALGDALPQRRRGAYPCRRCRGKSLMKSTLLAAMVLALLALPGPARAQNTDLLLVLAADGSRSIDESEFALQRKGYSAAVTDPRVLAAIRGGTTGTIAICFVEGSGAGGQNVVADWTVIHDEEDAAGLAPAILPPPRPFIGRTSITRAIDFAMERFAAAQPPASRHIIDISVPPPTPSCPP